MRILFAYYNNAAQIPRQISQKFAPVAKKNDGQNFCPSQFIEKLFQTRCSVRIFTLHSQTPNRLGTAAKCTTPLKAPQ